MPEEWIGKWEGTFDQGWDKLREETFARQKKLGIIPPDCDLTRRHSEIPAWDEKVCIQCAKCVAVCPHATIWMKVFEPQCLASAPAKAWNRRSISLRCSAVRSSSRVPAGARG